MLKETWSLYTCKVCALSTGVEKKEHKNEPICAFATAYRSTGRCDGKHRPRSIITDCGVRRLCIMSAKHKISCSVCLPSERSEGFMAFAN